MIFSRLYGVGLRGFGKSFSPLALICYPYFVLQKQRGEQNKPDKAQIANLPQRYAGN